MANWKEIGDVVKFPVGAKECLASDGIPLCVANIDGELVAIENVCPHAGLPLGQGELNGAALTCPFHGYTYNMKTGKNVDYEDDIPVRTFPIRQTPQGKIEVDLE